MSLRRRLATFVLAFAALLASASPAQAATSPADKAATWLTTQVSGGALNDGFSKVGASADGLIGLAAATDPAPRPTIDDLLAYVKANAASYVASGKAPGAAKLTLVAAAYGLDPTSFGGVDLVAAIRGGIEADGSVPPYPSAFSSGLTMTGLNRAGVSRPAALTTWLLTQQNADGGFGYAVGADSDADNTALAIMGLLTDSSKEAADALAKALTWAKKSQNADGSWAGYVPVNSTCVMGEALLAAGESASAATTYVRKQQLSSGAISTDGTTSGADVMATSQCLPLLGGVSYADVRWKPAITTTTTTTTKPATSTTTTGTSTATTSSTSGRGVPARTGVEDDATLPIAAVVLALGLGVAWLGRRR